MAGRNPTKLKVAGDDSLVSTALATETTLAKIPGLSVPIHDYISLTYTGSNLTGVVFKTGGAGGATVGTLTLAYDGSDQLTSVTKE